jgi:hypothetical protein
MARHSHDVSTKSAQQQNKLSHHYTNLFDHGKEEENNTMGHCQAALGDEDYLTNCITDAMKPKDIMKLQSEYKDVEYHNFICNNFCNLKIAIKKLKAKAETSNALLENYHRLLPIAANPANFPYPRWDGHEA